MALGHRQNVTGGFRPSKRQAKDAAIKTMTSRRNFDQMLQVSIVRKRQKRTRSKPIANPLAVSKADL